jgi:hypothetical protein
MKSNPLDKDLAFMRSDAPPMDPDFVAQDAMRSMLRVQNAAPLVGDEFAAAETVDQNLKWLLKLGGPGVPAFVVQVLHGELGEPAAKVAWTLFARGITIAGEKGSDVRVSVAAFCLANGTIDVLRALAEAGLPPVVHPGMFGRRQPPTDSMWLDMLCTTSEERGHPEFQGLANAGGLVLLAAVNYDSFPMHAQAALELAWSLDRSDSGFDSLVEDPSAAGAIVRAFVLQKMLEASTAATAGPSERARNRRAGL